MPRVLDVEQAMLLLELEAPFDQRTVQLARRRMAKRWHPDIAPPGRQHEHQRHLQAINEAADQLAELADTSRGGRVTRGAVKVSAAAARKAREEAGRRAYEAQQREQAAATDRAKHDPFGSRVPDHSVVHRYARCTSYPEWGVGTVSGIYFSGEDDDTQQWARMSFAVGVRTVPAGSLQFVDFSTPDPAADRVERFMTAAQHALAEGDAALAAKRLIYARDAEPDNPVVLRLLTAAFWQAGNLNAAARTVRDWSRADPDRPTPERFAARIYEDMGALDLAADAAVKATNRAPNDASAWARLGRLRLRLMDRTRAIEALEHARGLGPTVEGLLDLALAYHLAGDVGAEVSAAEAATRLDPESADAWSRYAHALARTDRLAECERACGRALALADNPEVRELLERVRAASPRELSGPGWCAPGWPSRRPPDRSGLRDLPLAPADRARLAGGKLSPATFGAVFDSLEHAEQLAHAAHQQALLVDLDPCSGRGREHDVVAGPDRHLHADVVPPVKARSDREHDPLLRGWLIRAGRDEQPGAPDPVGVELLDHDAVEDRAKLISHLALIIGSGVASLSPSARARRLPGRCV